MGRYILSVLIAKEVMVTGFKAASRASHLNHAGSHEWFGSPSRCFRREVAVHGKDVDHDFGLVSYVMSMVSRDAWGHPVHSESA